MSSVSTIDVLPAAALRRPPSGLPLSATLGVRTACGAVFDRLRDAELRCSCETTLGQLEWRCIGHHRRHDAVAPWSVAWSNGSLRVAVTLLPGPGAWAVAQSYFDRAPPALAWSLAAQVLTPWWAERADGPWVASPVGHEHYQPGGARAHAAIASRGLSFEFDLLFESVQAAQRFVLPGGVLVDTDVDTDAHDDAHDDAHERPAGGFDFPVRCAVRLGRLRLCRARVARLRCGDVLLIGPTVGPAAGADGDPGDTDGWPALDAVGAHAWLCVGERNQAVALLARDAGAWRVAAFPAFLTPEHVMDDPDFCDPAAAPLERTLGHVELPVDIVASRLAMRVDALQALRVGDVIALDHAVDESRVEVRVSGEACASGVLISFEGRLAVQLTELGPMRAGRRVT